MRLYEIGGGARISYCVGENIDDAKSVAMHYNKRILFLYDKGPVKDYLKNLRNLHQKSCRRLHLMKSDIDLFKAYISRRDFADIEQRVLDAVKKYEEYRK